MAERAIRFVLYAKLMALLFFVLGLVIGSFLSVLIVRLPNEESILGRSFCRRCRKTISWQDNIPVISYLFLKGRCRSCKSRISFQYPLLELLTAFLFLFSFFIYGDNLLFLVYILFLISLLIAIAFIDLKHFIIPDQLILTGFLVAVIQYLFTNFGSFLWPQESFVLGSLFFGGILLFLFLVSKGRWLGLGDVKFAALLGFVFGLEGSISIFYLTFFIGFIIAIILLVFKKADLKTPVPLGLVMSLAAVLMLLGFNLLNLINADLVLRLWMKN